MFTSARFYSPFPPHLRSRLVQFVVLFLPPLFAIVVPGVLFSFRSSLRFSSSPADSRSHSHKTQLCHHPQLFRHYEFSSEESLDAQP
ncbi:hypothetical protein FPV67DRAFT_1115758 [Lyophyllum atratum]|nr:hypothetical protein FPV67DRAFT_1115758 [Lyophyllum atratum]